MTSRYTAAMTPKEELVGTVVYEQNTYRSSTRNQFYLIIKETPKTVTLRRMDSIQKSGDGLRGTEVPSPKSNPAYDDPRYYIRARKNFPDEAGGRIWFSCKRQAFFLWDFKPLTFDYLD